MYRIILLSLLAVTLYSCQKKDTTTADPAKVTMSILSPASQHVYHSGDTIKINATVSYPSELHGYEVKIVDTATGNILYDNAQHVHDDHFDISQYYIYTGTQPVYMKLQLSAEVDHNGNEAEQDVYFQYQP